MLVWQWLLHVLLSKIWITVKCIMINPVRETDSKSDTIFGREETAYKKGHVWRTVLRLTVFLPGRDVCIPAVWLLLCQWHHPSVAGLLGVCGHSVGLWWAATKIIHHEITHFDALSLRISVIPCRRRPFHGRRGTYDRLSSTALHEVLLVLHHAFSLCGTCRSTSIFFINVLSVNG